MINIALNLVKGDNLAWQQRKAQSFTISPSTAAVGIWGIVVQKNMEPTCYIGQPLSLGTALAISGAAASPNMGYHSSSAVTFLLALFNIRLGWWLGNPGPAGMTTYHQASPTLSIRPLLAEAFGLTDACHPYVYLSDGGHFENLGLYEMVRRRCHCILVVDAGCDPAWPSRISATPSAKSGSTWGSISRSPSTRSRARPTPEPAPAIMRSARSVTIRSMTMPPPVRWSTSNRH